MSKCCRIVLTGGPGGGKTTAADLFRRELGEQVVIVPEAATLLYTGGFPRSNIAEVRRPTQRAIYQVQRNLEDAHAAQFKGRVLLCDRGTVDGAVYWPGSPDDFFASLNTTIENELGRYDAVVFFDTAAVGGISIEGGNPTRIESLGEAVDLNARLKALWSKHANFIHIAHETSFISKINKALHSLERIVNRLNQ